MIIIIYFVIYIIISLIHNMISYDIIILAIN